MNSINDINHAFFINLLSRPDRKQHVESQLSLLGINAERFNAIKMPNGALGCSISHLKCLKIAKEKNWPHLLIIEDDITFLNPELFKNQLNKFLQNHNNWDVVLIGGNNVPPYQNIDDTCIQVSKCQTTTGYLVNGRYIDTLIANFKSGIEQLMKHPEQHTLYAIDKYWFSLQQRDKWYLIIPLTVTQREDYSDIEKRPTNYSRVRLDIDKEAFFKAQQEQLLKQQRLVASSPKMNLFNF